MIFEELMHQYLDGTLSDADQTELFHIVSVSPEKRAEFNDYLTMRSVMVKDRISHVVPAGLEQSVLAAAAPPTLIDSSAVAAKEVGSIAGVTAAMMATVIMPLLIAGGLIASGVIGYVIGTKISNAQLANATSGSPVANIVQERQSAQAAQPVVGDNASTAKPYSYASHSLHGQIQEKTAHTSVATDAVFDEQNFTAPASNTTLNGTVPMNASQNTIEKLLATVNMPVSHTVAVMISSQGTEHITGLMQHERDPLHTNSQQPLSEQDNANDTLNYQLELQEGGGALFPNLSSSSLSAAPLVNTTALRFGVNIWDGAMFGIGIGQSTFGLQYSSQPNTLTTITYMQYSNLWYTGLYLQQSLSPIIGLTPRAMLELAGTNIGPLGNMQLGLSYPISGNVYASINGIMSDLMYRHNGAWLNSQKIGLMFGIGTEF
ncbi:MAG TPA: hypothetical protein VFA55_00840 [Candidatus Kapabacteria bacterium]|nr:hypothetical protein [Candidatus Kapabacteria bacterium]